MGKIVVNVQGIPEIARKLTPGHLYGAALQRAMKETRDYGEKAARKRAPRETGALEAAVTATMDAREVPLFAAIEIKPMPEGSGGFRYGGALDGSTRYHYRTTRNQGKPTKGWWSGVRRLMSAYLRRRLRRTVADIEATWNR